MTGVLGNNAENSADTGKYAELLQKYLADQRKAKQTQMFSRTKGEGLARQLRYKIKVMKGATEDRVESFWAGSERLWPGGRRQVNRTREDWKSWRGLRAGPESVKELVKELKRLGYRAQFQVMRTMLRTILYAGTRKCGSLERMACPAPLSLFMQLDKALAVRELIGKISCELVLNWMACFVHFLLKFRTL